MTQFLASIIVPTYNSIDKMSETVASLRSTTRLTNSQVIFVDDCSSDDTYSRLSEIVKDEEGWQVHRLAENSGSAASPRNRGIELATGTYVFFLDSDDIMEPEAFQDALAHAKKYNYDIVRSALYVRAGDGTLTVSDKIKGWGKIGRNTVDRIRAITRHQSLTCSFLMRRSLLNEHAIRFDSGRRIGEDIKFTAEVLAKVQSVGFRNRPIRTYVKASVGNESVTQRITSNQFSDFVRSWTDVEEALSERGVSFVKEHGFAAIQYALRQYLWFKSEFLSREVFDGFAAFCNAHWSEIIGFKFTKRLRELVDAAYEQNYDRFTSASRLRLVVAGHDLKFLDPLMTKFAEQYDVRIDQWRGHTNHDENLSQQLLDWCDLVWVEWLLGAADWYSRRIRSDQRLVIRAHRSEMVANYGLSVNWPKVSAVIAVSPTTLGDFADRFDVPRELFWLIPNALDIEDYAVGDDPRRLNRIGMIGILPRLKGFEKAIKMFARLHAENPELTLHIYGRRPHELDWLMRIDAEREYFDKCEALIDECGIRSAIVYEGWVDTTKAIADLGFVISMSDFEGLQVSVAEAYCCGAVGLTLNWRGAEHGYPGESILATPEMLGDRLRTLRSDPQLHSRAVSTGLSVVRDLYDTNKVWKTVQTMFKSIRA